MYIYYMCILNSRYSLNRTSILSILLYRSTSIRRYLGIIKILPLGYHAISQRFFVAPLNTYIAHTQRY